MVRDTRKEETLRDMEHARERERERTEEEGRIKRRPRRTRRDESEGTGDARYLRIQIKSLGRHVGEKKSGVVYRSSSYLTARPDSEIYLAPSPTPVSQDCDRTRSLDRRIEPMNVIHSRFLNKNFLYTQIRTDSIFIHMYINKKTFVKRQILIFRSFTIKSIRLNSNHVLKIKFNNVLKIH